jgi:hypothetical protein
LRYFSPPFFTQAACEEFETISYCWAVIVAPYKRRYIDGLEAVFFVYYQNGESNVKMLSRWFVSANTRQLHH